jgi:hypothetical protein
VLIGSFCEIALNCVSPNNKNSFWTQIGPTIALGRPINL